MPNRKLVVVDDSPSVLEALKQRLEAEGHTVLTADDGDRAVTLILREKPDLIISDIQMPNLDGYLLCQIVRSRPETREIPFIFLTSLTAAPKRVHGLKLGADDYVPKPFDMDELVLRVETILRRTSRATDAIRRRDEPKTLSGKLTEFALPDILQMLGLSRRSATIIFTRAPGEEGRIVVREGRIVGARTDASAGRKAFFRLFLWKEAEFRLDYSQLAAAEENMDEEVEHATMEALVHLDEESTLVEKLGGRDVKLAPVMDKELPEGVLGREGRYVLALAHKLGGLEPVLDASAFTDLDTLKHVARLTKLGVLEIRTGR